ncbi:MAG: hypothetical protein JWM57_3149 [Phycisphaerales bacterium]|nr:hypothetical protein [Phycisphaerales bacterium]
MLNRRTLLQGSLLAAAGAVFDRLAIAVPPASQAAPSSIDRKAVVTRHNVRRTASKTDSPLQVGNGNFAFGADITGLQTFIPFNTMSQWAWHSDPFPAGHKPSDMVNKLWPGRTRSVPYDSGDRGHAVVTDWLFFNPFRMNLGRIGLMLRKADGTTAVETDLTDTHQELDLWTGTLRSQFTLDGQPVTVTTAGHPELDAVAVRIESAAVAQGNVSAYVDFVAPDHRDFAAYVGTRDLAGRIPTTVTASADHRTDLSRKVDDDAYHTAIQWRAGTTLNLPEKPKARKVTIVQARYGAGANWLDVTRAVADLYAHEQPITASNKTFGSDPAAGKVKRLEVIYLDDGQPQNEKVDEGDTWLPGIVGGRNCFRLTSDGNTIEFTVAFSPKPLPAAVPTADETFAAAEKHWPAFWQSGAAIDLSGSADPRWSELERRVVLSQYLMAINEAGELPPQESGLVNNGWSGKFHMEMYWWHATHYALWNRWPLLDRSSGIYDKMLGDAKTRAKRQGFKGARWTKMTGPDFHNAPNYINALLVWQQPHPMFFAELEYRARPNRATLDKWKTVLFEAADFMASFAELNPKTGKYDLGPSVMVLCENNDPAGTVNPAFELSYWRFGLRIAQAWRERLGLPREATWDHVLKDLAPLPIDVGVYVTYDGIPAMWTKNNDGHPATIGAFGWLPGDAVDSAVMRATLDRTLAKWKTNGMWGWDFPMLAMCAARLGEPALAIDQLLTSSGQFQFDDAGFASGGPFPYFPSNGGLLYAVAMMAAGWDGSPADRNAPGFPSDGSWVVKIEGMSLAI